MTEGLPSIAAVGEASLLKARENITGCHACDESASRSFQSVLAQALENGGMVEYLVGLPIACPRCASPILETTLVTVLDERRTVQRSQIVEPPDDEINLVFVDEITLFEAERFISGCESCLPEVAEITFDYILDEITGCDPTITDYTICHPARCRRCRNEVLPKTLVVTQ
jgi:hypothetical protein